MPFASYLPTQIISGLKYYPYINIIYVNIQAT
jgi:hypothetical protein